MLHYKKGIYEVNRLIVQKWAYGERIFSAAFLGMMLGLLVGWWNERLAAALVVAGFVLTAALPFLKGFTRPDLGPDPQGIALGLLPFLAVGLAYAYSGRSRSSVF